MYPNINFIICLGVNIVLILLFLWLIYPKDREQVTDTELKNVTTQLVSSICMSWAIPADSIDCNILEVKKNSYVVLASYKDLTFRLDLVWNRYVNIEFSHTSTATNDDYYCVHKKVAIKHGIVDMNKVNQTLFNWHIDFLNRRIYSKQEIVSTCMRSAKSIASNEQIGDAQMLQMLFNTVSNFCINTKDKQINNATGANLVALLSFILRFYPQEFEEYLTKETNI